MEEDKRKFYKQFARVSAIGLEMGLSVAIGVAIGYLFGSIFPHQTVVNNHFS